MSDGNVDLGSTNRAGWARGWGVLPGIYVTEAELSESKGFGKWKRDEQSQILGSVTQRRLEGMWICIYLS